MPRCNDSASYCVHSIWIFNHKDIAKLDYDLVITCAKLEFMKDFKEKLLVLGSCFEVGSWQIT